MLWTLWLIMGLMLMMALVLILWPLLKPRAQNSYISHDALNIKLYKEKQTQLHAAFTEKEITQEEYIQLEIELKKSLLETIDPYAKKKLRTKPAYWMALALFMLLPFFSIFIYNHLGSSEKLNQYWALKKQAKEVKTLMAKIKNPQQIIDQLKAHLKIYPNSSKGWYLLGRFYLGEEKYAKAVKVLSKAHQLKPNSKEYSVAYAQAVFFANNRNLTPAMVVLLKSIIKKDQYNVSAINLLAINAYVNKRYQLAVNYWERLIPIFTPGSRDSQMLLSMIGASQKNIAKQATVKSIADIVIKIWVQLDPKLRAKITPNEKVFIYAQLMKGSPMPLAVVRIKASDLPATINLTNRQAMVPGHTLMLGQIVKVIARVSKSGSPMPQIGDFESASKVLTVQMHNHPAKLIINQIKE